MRPATGRAVPAARRAASVTARAARDAKDVKDVPRGAADTPRTAVSRRVVTPKAATRRSVASVASEVRRAATTGPEPAAPGPSARATPNPPSVTARSAVTAPARTEDATTPAVHREPAAAVPRVGPSRDARLADQERRTEATKEPLAALGGALDHAGRALSAGHQEASSAGRTRAPAEAVLRVVRASTPSAGRAAARGGTVVGAGTQMDRPAEKDAGRTAGIPVEPRTVPAGRTTAVAAPKTSRGRGETPARWSPPTSPVTSSIGRRSRT